MWLLHQTAIKIKETRTQRIWLSVRAKTSPPWRGKPTWNSSYGDSNWRVPRPWPLTLSATPRPRHNLLLCHCWDHHHCCNIEAITAVSLRSSLLLLHHVNEVSWDLHCDPYSMLSLMYQELPYDNHHDDCFIIPSLLYSSWDHHHINCEHVESIFLDCDYNSEILFRDSETI